MSESPTRCACSREAGHAGPCAGSLIERLKREVANPDTSGAPYVNDPDLLAECLAEIKRLSDEVSDLRGFIDGLKPHIREAAAMYGFGSHCAEKDSGRRGFSGAAPGLAIRIPLGGLEE